MIKYFKSCVTTNYANFSGRARRKEFFGFFIVFLIICGFLYLIYKILERSEDPNTLIIFAALGAALALVLPCLAVGVRRLHDINKSGWYIIIGFIPVVQFVLLYFYLKSGDKGENQYGPDPKALDA